MKRSILAMALIALALCAGCDDKSDDSGKTYGIGDKGPGGGVVFYVADEVQTSTYKDSTGAEKSYKWKYLEAAPADVTGSNGQRIFGYYRASSSDPVSMVVSDTTANVKIGAGRYNTRALVNAMGSANVYATDSVTTPTSEAYAAKACEEYRGGGFSDWFLPSKNELHELYMQKDKLGFTWSSYDWHWTSSEVDEKFAWSERIAEGKQSNDQNNRSGHPCVRPVRAFL